MLFFCLPTEFDPAAMHTHTHVVHGEEVVQHPAARGLAAAGGVFTEKTLEFFPTVVFRDVENSGFLSFNGDNENKMKRVLKQHDLRTCELDALIDRPAFSRGAEGYRPESDVLLLRMFGEHLKCKGESLWSETEMFVTIDRAALQAGDLREAQLRFGENS